MGTWYLFECPTCDFFAQVSGGDDVGMMSRTTTITCKDCEDLYDVTTSKEPWNVNSSTQQALICSENGHHRVERWVYPGPCPKCKTQLVRSGIVAHWD